MNPHQLVAIAVRLFAIWYSIFLFKELPASFFAELQYANEINPIKVSISAITVMFAPILWFAANRIARLIVPRPLTETPLKWSESQILTVGASIVGLWVMAYSLSPIIYYGTLWFLTQKSDIGGWDDQRTASLASAFAVLAIGIWLFLGARGLWKVWAHLRGRAES